MLRRPPPAASDGAVLSAALVVAPGRERARRPTFRGIRLVQLSFVAPAILYLVALCAYPIFYNLKMSLEHVTVGSFLTGTAPFVGLRNYVDLWSDRLFFQSFATMAVFTALSIAGQM